MPKVVDHESRRREIAEAVWRTVERRGLEAATVREIAAEAGYSTGVLAHYFGDKDELLTYALQVSVEDAVGRMRSTANAGESGLAALRGGLHAVLPLDERGRAEWRVWLGFWGRAAGERSGALISEHERWYAPWREVVRELLEVCREEGSIPAVLDAGLEARMLVAFVDGLGIEAALEPGKLPPEEQVSMLDRYLSRLAGS